MFCHLLVRALSCFYKKVEIIDFATLSNLLFKYSIFHENKQFLSSFEMCCFICFHLKVDFSVQWCTAREQVYCDFMLFQWRSRTLSGKHQGANSSKQPLNLIILIVFLCEVQM